MPELYFEDFLPGEVVTYGNYPVDRDEIIAFATEFDPQPFHLSEEAARDTFAGELIASGWHTNAMLNRINCDAFLNRSACIGSPGVDEVRWIHPVRPNDRLHLRRTTLEALPSRSKPDRGVVRFAYELFNQDDVQVCHHNCMVMFQRRAPGHVASGHSLTGRSVNRAAKEVFNAEEVSSKPRTAIEEVPFFDDLTIGETRIIGEYEFTSDKIRAFAQSYDNQGFHLDPAIAAAGPYGGIIASGWHTASAWMGQMASDRAKRTASAKENGKPAANLGVSPGFRAMRWLKPVRAGDRLTYYGRLVDKRPSAKRPKWGLAFHENWAENAENQRVFSFVSSVFWERRRPGAGRQTE